MIPLNCWLDADNDQIVFTVPADQGEGDVAVLTLDLDTLSDDDRRRLGHVRNPDRPQRPATAKGATRGVG